MRKFIITLTCNYNLSHYHHCVQRCRFTLSFYASSSHTLQRRRLRSKPFPSHERFSSYLVAYGNTINYMKGKMWDAFRENLLKTKKARLSVPRFRTTRLTIINHVIHHICILNEKVLPLLVSRAQALHGQAVFLWKQDNPFQDFDADHFYDITSQHRDDNSGLFKKQWERNFFAATVGDCTALFAQCWRKA